MFHTESGTNYVLWLLLWQILGTLQIQFQIIVINWVSHKKVSHRNFLVSQCV